MFQSLAGVVVVFAATFVPLSICKPAATTTNLCSGGKGYCEHPRDYPLAIILQALKNQSELVQTPGLFDSPIEQNRGRELTLSEDDVGKPNIDVDNHIVSY